jgi:large subunit ribosomal protein L30
MDALRITLTRSLIGHPEDQRATAKMLGLHRMQQSVLQPDTPSIRGMVFKIRHLVTVEPVEVRTDEETASAESTAGVQS